MVWAIFLLTPYLEGAQLKIQTDHDALQWILTLSDASGKMERWRLRLSEFEFDVVQQAIVKHQTADGLLWLSTDKEDKIELNNALPVLTLVPANKAKVEAKLIKTPRSE